MKSRHELEEKLALQVSLECSRKVPQGEKLPTNAALGALLASLQIRHNEVITAEKKEHRMSQSFANHKIMERFDELIGDAKDLWEEFQRTERGMLIGFRPIHPLVYQQPQPTGQAFGQYQQVRQSV